MSHIRGSDSLAFLTGIHNLKLLIALAFQCSPHFLDPRTPRDAAPHKWSLAIAGP